AVILLSAPFIGGNTKLAADLTLKYRLPAVTLFSEFAVNGGLISYGPILLDIYRRLGRPCCQSAAWKQSGQSAGRTTNEFRAGCKPQNCKIDRHCDADLCSSASRFGN